MEQEPTFKAVFGEVWEQLPPAIRARYANRPYSQDRIKAEGRMDITYSPLIRFLMPILQRFGALMPFEGKSIPVTVIFHSEPDSDAFCFDRIIHYPNGQEAHFRSKMHPYKPFEVIEFIRFGVGLRLRYEYDGKDTVALIHKGYVWKYFGALIPLPLSLVFGEAFGEEIAVSDTMFKMRAGARHFLLGVTFEYKGEFSITEGLDAGK